MTQIKRGGLAILLMVIMVLGYGGLCSKSSSSSGSSVPGPVPTTVTFSTQPVNTVADATIANVVVNVKDAANANMVGQAVSVTTTDGTLLSGTLITNTDAAGNATFNDLSMTLVGTYALSATAGSVITASANFNITPGAATKGLWVINPVSPQTTAVAFTPAFTIEITDTYGNRITTDSTTVVTVTRVIVTGAGTVTAGSIATASSGLATFSTFTITGAGTYDLVGTPAALTPTPASATITIN